MIIHDDSIKKIVEHRKNELSENIDTYVLKLYSNIGTYTIFEFHYVHTDNISVYIYTLILSIRTCQVIYIIGMYKNNCVYWYVQEDISSIPKIFFLNLMRYNAYDVTSNINENTHIYGAMTCHEMV